MVQGTDVFIIGGGPVGLAAAIAARKKGFEVTVADGAPPPIDKVCGEGLLPDTLAALGELGVVVPASAGYPVRGIRFLGREHEVAASFPGDHGIGIRRQALHQRLVEQAMACGVSLLWKTPVTGIHRKAVMLADGLVLARWIIGADGIGSRVRKWTGLDAPVSHDCRYAFRRHYRIRPWSDFLEIYWGENAQAYVTPVNREEVCVVLISRQAGIRFASLDAKFPQLARRLEPAAHASAERGAVTMMQQLKRVYRGQVALIGDASGSVDAITGEGLSLGFRQAVALARALEAGDLSHYQDAHRRLARRPALMGRLLLLLDGQTALRERTMRVLASNTDVFSRLLAIHVGAKSRAHLATAGALLGWGFVAA
jgi:flavin-dependent dehydrogenase